MEHEIRALCDQVRSLVATIERIEFNKKIEKISSRGNEKDMVDEMWEKTEPRIHKNFESWRDYLYKYSLAMISILGFLASLIATRWIGEINVTLVVISIICIGFSIAVTFLSMFVTLYLERVFIETARQFTLCMKVGYGNEKDGIKHPARCVERYYDELIPKREKELEELQKQRQIDGLGALDQMRLDYDITDLKTGIKHDKRTRSLMKFVGFEYTSYEAVRLWITIAVIVMSFAGLGIMFYALLENYSSINSSQEIPVQEEVIRAPN